MASNIHHRIDTAWDNLSPAERQRRVDAVEPFGQFVHISDTVTAGPQSSTVSRLVDMYATVAKRYSFSRAITPDFVGTVQGHPLQTATRALVRIGQNRRNAELADGIEPVPLSILVNNAPRSDHARREKAQGDKCLWAHVGRAHVVGVGSQVFEPLLPYADWVRIVEGIPGHPNLADISNGSQFRSLEHYVRVQVAAALGILVQEFHCQEINERSNVFRDDTKLGDNEALIGDRDEFGNLLLYPARESLEEWLKESAGVSTGAVADVQFLDPETQKEIHRTRVRVAESLTSHTGEICIWPSSSYDPAGNVFPNVYVSQERPGQRVPELDALPLGTKVQLFSGRSYSTP